MKEVMSINASQQTHTPAGDLLSKMYYGTFLESLLKRREGEYSGYPDNEGSHTLQLNLSTDDLQAFLELVNEHFLFTHFRDGAIEFVSSVLQKVATGEFCRISR